MIVVVVHDGTGKIEQVVTSPVATMLNAYLDIPNALFCEFDTPPDPELYTINPSTKALIPITPAVETLEELKAKLLVRIDEEAEAARLAFLTPGSGQAMEYEDTESQARGYIAGTLTSSQIPLVVAEKEAREDADETGLTLTSVANDIIAQADTWRLAQAEIKKLRRAAKLKVTNAGTKSGAKARARVDWPTP